jgi:hypothetical protein
LKIGVFLRNAFLLAFGLVWFAFIVAAITSPPPKANCVGKSEAECRILQKKLVNIFPALRDGDFLSGGYAALLSSRPPPGKARRVSDGRVPAA